MEGWSSGDIRARAVCGCGSDEFHVFVYSCGCERSACIACGRFWEAAWTTAGRGSSVQSNGDKAVGEGRDVAADVVSSAQRAKGLTRDEAIRWVDECHRSHGLSYSTVKAEAFVDSLVQLRVFKIAEGEAG
jgi:hypothetical protein